MSTYEEQIRDVLTRAQARADFVKLAVRAVFGGEIENFTHDEIVVSVAAEDVPKINRLLRLMFDPDIDPYTACAAAVNDCEPEDVDHEARYEIKHKIVAYAFGASG